MILVPVYVMCKPYLRCRYEDSFNRFIDEVNSVAAYDWWEGSVHSRLSLLAYPCGWSWKQWRRKYKINRLQEFVKSEYDHSCLRSCRSRALYKGMKVYIRSYYIINFVLKSVSPLHSIVFSFGDNYCRLVQHQIWWLHTSISSWVVMRSG